MQILLVHSDFLQYRVERSTKMAEKIEDFRKGARIEEPLIAFTAVEKPDESREAETVKQAAEAIRDVARQVKAPRLVLYPYAHLSSDLARPEAAIRILKALESELQGEMEVHRVPFGWYKSFELRCKGHPLAELSRTIRPGGAPRAPLAPAKVIAESEALAREQKLRSTLQILDPQGKRHDPQKFPYTEHPGLGKFVHYEMAKSRAVEQMPPHVEIMRRLQMVDHEPGSDSGNLRYYPKGRLVKALLETYISERMAAYGALEVETPLMYDVNHPTLRSYLDRFPARQYNVESDKRDLFLRFAACFGQFLMGKDMVVSYRNLPLRMFEMTRYSFRREQSGELAGLRRLRAFTMPDMHTFCADMDQALEEFRQQYRLAIDVLRRIGIEPGDYEVGLRFTREFADQNPVLLRDLVAELQKPVLTEEWTERFFYFVVKFEFNFVDALDKASALATVQIDVENAERYGIKYIDAEGKERSPVILHCSPSGAVERAIYALLEKAWMGSQPPRNKAPMLPAWLSPTQVRLIPVAEAHIPHAQKTMEALGGLRVDMDDREETVQKKVRDAAMEWVPYIAVIGDKEVQGDNLTVTVREESTTQKTVNRKMKVEELRKLLEEKTRGMPTRPLPLAPRMSVRPKFM